MPILDLDAGALHYDLVGEGPAVLFVHGSLGAGAQWRRLVQAVVDAGFTAVTPDLPGYGKNEPWPLERRWTPAVDAIALNALVDELGTPVHLVTHSGGTTFAFPVLGDRPEMVRSTTWLEPSLWGLLHERNDPRLEEIVALARAYVSSVQEGDREEAVEVFIDTWARRPGTWAATPEEMQERLRRVAGRLFYEWHIWLEAHAPFRPYTEDICALRIDPLLVKGADTIEAIHAVCESVVELRPGTRVVEVDGAGHNVPFTHAEQVADPLIDHLRVAEATA